MPSRRTIDKGLSREVDSAHRDWVRSSRCERIWASRPPVLVRRGSLKRLVICLVSLLGIGALITSAAAAHPKVREAVRLHVSLSATKASDGSISEKIVFTASNSHYLSAKELKRRPDGVFSGAAGLLLFGPNQYGEPADEGFLQPSPGSHYGASPFVWEGTILVTKRSRFSKGERPKLPLCQA